MKNEAQKATIKNKLGVAVPEYPRGWNPNFRSRLCSPLLLSFYLIHTCVDKMDDWWTNVLLREVLLHRDTYMYNNFNHTNKHSTLRRGSEGIHSNHVTLDCCCRFWRTLGWIALIFCPFLETVWYKNTSSLFKTSITSSKKCVQWGCEVIRVSRMRREEGSKWREGWG